MLILHLSIWFHFSTRNHCKLSGMYCRLITCLEQWMSLEPFFQPTTIANRGGKEVGGHLLHSINQELIIATFIVLVFITRIDSSSEAWLRSYPAGVYLRLFLHYLFVVVLFQYDATIEGFLIAIALVLNHWGKLTACGSRCSPTPYCLVLPYSPTVFTGGVGLRFDTMLAFTWGACCYQEIGLLST